jgi:glycyl-tRNA synthetase beta chain
VERVSDGLASGATTQTRDFLLELRCEEIPARMQAGARAELDKLFRDHMAATGVTHGEIVIWSTPRRLALIARDLPRPPRQCARRSRGPRPAPPRRRSKVSCARSASRASSSRTAAARCSPIVERPGRETRGVLAWAVAAMVRNFAWPKSMRWGAASLRAESLRWVRPLSGIVAILGEDLVECEVGGVASGYATLGHRFHHAGPITIGGAHDYQEKLRACHVIVDHAEREALIRLHAREGAAAAGLALVEGRRPGGRERGPHRVAGAAARRLRPGVPRSPARSHPAHRPHQPEVLRV